MLFTRLPADQMLLPCLAATLRPALRDAPVPRMFHEAAGIGIHDVYGFEPVILPALPSGARLSIEEIAQEGAQTDEQRALLVESFGDLSPEDSSMWQRIMSYVDISERGTADASLVGAEVWPAAAALCNWMRDFTDLRDLSVLEIGSGTGVCGLYAAGLGAGRVMLTDGGPPALEELTRRNIERNRPLTSRCAVSFERLEWGDEKHLLASQRFDWVLASDCTYGHDSHDALATTLHALLSTSSANPPRVVFAHEHRERDLGLREQVSAWDEADPLLADFLGAASRAGLSVTPLWTQRPHGEVRGAFCHWTADLSIFEVDLLNSELDPDDSE